MSVRMHFFSASCYCHLGLQKDFPAADLTHGSPVCRAVGVLFRTPPRSTEDPRAGLGLQGASSLRPKGVVRGVGEWQPCLGPSGPPWLPTLPTHGSLFPAPCGRRGAQGWPCLVFHSHLTDLRLSSCHHPQASRQPEERCARVALAEKQQQAFSNSSRSR